MPGAQADGPADQPGEGSEIGESNGQPKGNTNPNGAPKRGRATNNNGGGGNGGGNAQMGDRKEDPKPLPTNTDQPPANPDPSVAPDVPQSELVTRTIKDLLRDEKFTPDLQKQLGMTRDEAEQFVKKYEKKPAKDPIGSGREIQAKPGEEKVLDPNRKAPEFNTSAIVSSRNNRSGTTLTTDSMSGLTEGGHSKVPPELQRQWQAYRKNLAGSGISQPAATSPAANPGSR